MIGDYICASDETESAIFDGLDNGTMEFWREDIFGRQWFRRVIHGTPKGVMIGVDDDGDDSDEAHNDLGINSEGGAYMFGVTLEDAEIIEAEDGTISYVFPDIEADDDDDGDCEFYEADDDE